MNTELTMNIDAKAIGPITSELGKIIKNKANIDYTAAIEEYLLSKHVK